jgi:hypothetical protein
MELTQEHFDRAVSKLATQEGVDGLAERLNVVESTLRTHTAALEKLLTKKKTREDETLISSERLKRIEDFCQAAAKQLNIKFDL